VSRDFHVV